jgi:exopolyphosphatase/guanosine-5'-triphosphate,3'-diphosphate pyrophosphatase
MVQVERGKGEITSVRGVRLLRSELEALAKRLRRANHRERLSMPGIPAKRADLLPTAALVLAELIALLELSEILVSDWGLREGVLLRRQGAARRDRAM